MPMLILALAVIPGGIEGASYAMITTWMNVAYEVGTNCDESMPSFSFSIFYRSANFAFVFVMCFATHSCHTPLNVLQALT